MKRIIFFLLFPLLHASAQDLTGIWRGTFYSSPYEIMYGSNNKYEVQIDNSGRALKGVTYSYQNTKFYGKATLIGMWTPGTKNLIFKEENLLDYRMSDGDESNVSMFTCYLEYRKEGNKEILEGNFTSQGYKSERPGDNGKIYLERVTTTDFKKEDFIVKKEKADSIKKAMVTKPVTKQPVPNTIAKQNVTPPKKTTTKPVVKQPIKPTKPAITATKPAVKPKTNTATVQKTPKVIKKPAPPATAVIPPAQKTPVPEVVTAAPPKKIELPTELPQVLKERKNDLVKTITTSANEITVSFYDNGEIDGDTISVFLNGRQIAAHKGLSTKPVTLKIKIDEANPDQEITMVAENLGSIPPNTALMIVNAGDQRYDLHLSSSNQNNAVVRFHYAPSVANANK